MLRFMRKHASRWLLGIICGIISVVFVLTFGFNKGGGDKVVAEVGSYKISALEYQDAYQKMLNYYRMIYRDKFDDAMAAEVKKNAMNQLVDKYVLLKKADEMGVRISDKEFADYLGRIDAFKRNGKFDKQVYEEMLKRNNLDPKAFEENERQSLVIGKLVSIIQDNGTRVDDDAAYRSYLKENGQVKLSIAVFDPADFRDKVSVDEKELNAVYDKEKAGYRSETAYHLKYMVIEDGSGVKDDQAYMDLLKTKDMSGYGKTKGVEIVDLGMVKESELVTKFARLKVQEWLKGMGKGDISLPVRETNRSYIFQIVDRQDGKPLEQAEAVKLIRTRLVNEKARVLARAKAEDGVKDKGTKFTKETSFLSRNSTVIIGVGQIPKEDLGIFGLSRGQVYQKPVDIGGKYYLFAGTEEKTPESGQWEKDKETYKQIFAAKTRDEYFTAFKDELRKKTKVKVDWKDI